MQKHTKVYMSHFGFTKGDFIPCEICEKPATDIHHIDARGMGGSKTKDVIENLMALCRKCHEQYGDIKDLKDHLKQVHEMYIKQKIK